MKKIKINMSEKDNKIEANVELPRRYLVREPIQTFSNSDMLNYLKEQGIELEEYTSESIPNTELTSYATKNIEPNLIGKWIFSKKDQIKPKVQTSKRSRTKKSTTT